MGPTKQRWNACGYCPSHVSFSLQSSLTEKYSYPQLSVGRVGQGVQHRRLPSSHRFVSVTTNSAEGQICPVHCSRRHLGMPGRRCGAAHHPMRRLCASTHPLQPGDSGHRRQTDSGIQHGCECRGSGLSVLLAVRCKHGPGSSTPAVPRFDPVHHLHRHLSR